MQPIDKHIQFIDLRGQGQSQRAAAKSLHISKDTAKRWDLLYKEHIQTAQSDYLQALYNRYQATLEQRLATIGSTALAIKDELANRDLSDVDTDKLLAYQLQYLQALAALYIPPQADISDLIKAGLPPSTLRALIEAIKARDEADTTAQIEAIRRAIGA